MEGAMPLARLVGRERGPGLLATRLFKVGASLPTPEGFPGWSDSRWDE